MRLLKYTSNILIFDVNETLLDLSPLKPHFQLTFGDANVMKHWFLTLLHSSLTVTLADDYKDFGKLAGAALDVVAKIRNVSLTDEDRKTILETIKKLPPHADVPESLERLHSNGFRLFTLTNSPPETLRAQMENSGLLEYFEDTFSVEDVRKFKPAIATYQSVAKKLGVEPSEMRMIAAHDWDIAGATNAGCQTAYIAREGKVYNALYKKPDISGKDLNEVAEKILNQ